jgi:hypothetical protein
MYTHRGLGYSGTPTEVSVASTNYQICLGAIASGIESMYPRVRAQVAEWEQAARAAGVHEANIIAFLGPFNVWEETVTTLSGGTIPREIQRVQQGGAVPNPEKWQAGCDMSLLTAYQPPRVPAIPSVESMLTAQGGARTGTAQYDSPISVTQPRVSIEIPAAVQEEAGAGLLPTLTTNVKAQYTPTQQAEVLPTVFTPKPTATNGSGYNRGGDMATPTLDFGGEGAGNGVTDGGKTALLVGGALALLLLVGKKKRGRR